jgi:hypothetical protein
MHQGYPHYSLHHGPPFSFGWDGEWGYPSFSGPVYPGWGDPYAQWGEWGYPFGYLEADPYVGFDVSSIPDTAMKWGREAWDDLSQLGSAASEALKHAGQGISGAFPSVTAPLGTVGSAAQKAGTAADATTLAADEARKSIAHVTRKADATLDQIQRTAKEHEETVRVVKYVMVGIAVLGGVALVYAVAK